MTAIVIRRAHRLAPEETRRRVERLAAKIHERFGADCRWDGDRLLIEHGSVNGRVLLQPGEVVVEATLGLGLGLFRRRAEDEIGRILDKELA